jgi:hypothetical protein
MKMINISINNSGIKELDSNDPLFTINGRMIVSRRAGIKIESSCPGHIINMIAKAYDQGWIKPVAYVTDEEYMVMKLSN